MNPLLPLLCVLATLVATGCAEELMFFADDHYKAAGEPQLKASAVNPVLGPGANSTLRITLENVGLIQELISNNAGDTNEISAEAKDELHSVDADNIIVRPSGYWSHIQSFLCEIYAEGGEPSMHGRLDCCPRV